jgi:hypothetical protein
MNTGSKVFLACALGALAGTYVALQMIPLLWWIGLFVGGLVGYLSYEWKQVVSATLRVWESVTSRHPNWVRVSLFFKAWALLMGMCVNICAPILLWTLCYMAHNDWRGCIMQSRMMLYASAIICLLISFLSALCPQGGQEQVCRDLRQVGIPVIFWLWNVPMRFIRNIIYCVRHTPQGFEKVVAGFMVLIRFASGMFLLIHSEMRLLCAVDATIGVVIGHHFGNSLIGGLAGGLLGVLNFEVLSIRILKLVPQSNSILSL